MKIYENIHDAYLGTVSDVYDNPEYRAAPRGQKTKEITDYSFRILYPKVEFIKTKDAKRNRVISDYSEKEFNLYESGTNNVKDFAKASKFWNKIANPDGTVNSAYGHLIWHTLSCGNGNFEHSEKHNNIDFDQDNDILSYTEAINARESLNNGAKRSPWAWARQSLLDDENSRQAILRFSLPEHQWRGNKDQVCTLHGNFLIRENKLNLSITMRSNDLMLGLVYDLPWFISLIYKMKEELASRYPDLEVGTYTHNVHSMHLYDRDGNAILKMLGRIKTYYTKPQKHNAKKGTASIRVNDLRLMKDMDIVEVFDVIDEKTYKIKAHEIKNDKYYADAYQRFYVFNYKKIIKNRGK